MSENIDIAVESTAIRDAVSRSVSQEAVCPGFKNVRNKRCRVCTRDEIRSLRPRPRAHGEKPFRFEHRCVSACECISSRLTLLRFDSHSATRYPPVDAPTVARPFSTIPPTSLKTFLFFGPFYSGFRRHDRASSLI